jgi:hypothetical protein
MHPAIKIISLCVLSFFSTQGEWKTLLLTGVLLLPFYIISPGLWASAFTMLSRLKWLFFSILLVYSVLTPVVSTDLLLDCCPENTIFQLQFGAFLYQLLPGFFRVAVLVLIILAVNLFLKSTTKEQILAALLWLFYPLKFLNFDIERISLRAVLTLEYIEFLSSRFAQFKKRNKNNSSLPLNFKQKKEVFFHLIETSGTMIIEILDEAEKTTGRVQNIDYLEAPMPLQLLVPIILILYYINLS